LAIVVTILQIVAPVFILALIGFLWVRSGAEYQMQFVTRLAMTISLPCLVFSSLMKTQIDPVSLAAVFLASVVAYPVIAIVTFALVRLSGLQMKTFLAPLIFGNTGNLGLPLALFAFGETGLGYAVVIFAVMAIYSFTFGAWIVAGGGSFLKLAKEPIVGATLLGALFLYQGWQTPVWMTNTLDLIGQMAIPLMLITLGVAVGGMQIRGLSRAVLLSIIKVIIAVAVAWMSGIFFNLPPVALAVLVLQVSTPVAVTSYLMAEKFNANAAEVAGLVVISTMLSVVSIPLVLALFL